MQHFPSFGRRRKLGGWGMESAPDRVMRSRRCILLAATVVLEGCTALASMTVGEQTAPPSGESGTHVPASDAGTDSAPRRSVTSPEGGGALWMLNGPGNEAQAMATDPNGIAFFGQGSVQTLYPIDHRVPPPPGWRVTYFKRYTSFATFQTDVATKGAIADSVQVVVYDNEAWVQTPSDEQADPITYARRFAQLAHEKGYAFMNTPAENLMQAMFPGENKYLSFLKYGYASAVAPDCDYYEIQGQQIENDTSGNETNPSFDWFTEQVAAQARSANPKVIVLGGVVAKTGYSASDIVNAVRSTRNVVSGYWLNVLCELDCTRGNGLDNTKIASTALATLLTDISDR
jgi:hypothetical protein